MQYNIFFGIIIATLTTKRGIGVGRVHPRLTSRLLRGQFTLRADQLLNQKLLQFEELVWQVNNNSDCIFDAGARLVYFSVCMKLGSYFIMDAAALQVLSFSRDRKLVGRENANKTTSSTTTTKKTKQHLT